LLLSSTPTNIFAAEVNYQQKLVRADKIRTSKRKEFLLIIDDLTKNQRHLSEEQNFYYLYLKGFKQVIAGNLKGGISLLDQVIKQTKYQFLQHRAITTKFNVYTYNENYQEGFSVLNRLLPMIDQMEGKETYMGALFVVATFYNRLTQYHLSQEYVTKMLQAKPALRMACLASMLQIQSAFNLKELTWSNIKENKVLLCEEAHEYIASNMIYNFMAKWYLEQNQPDLSLSLLLPQKKSIEETQYYLLISDYYATLADAYFRKNDFSAAMLHAERVMNSIKPAQKSESIVTASYIIYQIKKLQGNFQQALHFQEIFQKQTQLVNDDINKRSISYQIAQKDIKDKIYKISILDEKNKVLNLEKKLSKASAQRKQVMITLLLFAVLGLLTLFYRSILAQSRLKKIADHDELTGIFNRRCFNELADSALDYCTKTNQAVSLILFDLDNFKRINDNYGHQVGDWVLKTVIKTCQQLCRKNDIIGRFGGEEFTILLPGCNEAKAAELAEKYRSAICDISSKETGFDLTISASFGIYSSNTGHHNLQNAIKSADQAMYYSKNNGRNQVSIYNDNVDYST
jgi:diguanylate cyclase (GGDEF)-like protein